MQSVPLKRKFTPIPAAYQRRDFPLDEVWSSLNRGENKSWDDLLGEYRVVVLAEAGAGKTYELQSAAKRLVSQGRLGFFIRIEDIDDDFGTAFEVGSEAAFEDWLAGTDEAWFSSTLSTRSGSPSRERSSQRSAALPNGSVMPASERISIFQAVPMPGAQCLIAL